MAAISFRKPVRPWALSPVARAKSSEDAADVAAMKSGRTARKLNRAHALEAQLSNEY